MQDIVASCENHRFDIEIALDQQLGLQNLPFPGMDKSGAAICTFYLKGLCTRGSVCPLRHTAGNQSTVCKHWLRGLCKKGDACEFLHEYDMSKMPECYFYQRLGQCCNKECPFLHIDPESKIKNCAWYDRGFCRHGPNCKNRHVRKVICTKYLFGFCPDGKECKQMHPRFELPTGSEKPGLEGGKRTFVCHSCGETGHKAAYCLKNKTPVGTIMSLASSPSAISTIGSVGSTVPHSTPPVPASSYAAVQTAAPPATTVAAPGPASYDPSNRRGNYGQPGQPFIRRPLQEVTCFKCGDKGHYANRCPKGMLAFLHNPQAS